jgi:hypothetical protein
MINSTHPKAAPMANPHKNMMARGLAKLQTQANDPYDTDGDNDTWDSMDSMRHGKC